MSLSILCDPAAVEVWDHDGKLYEVNSYYSLPDVAWQYELIGLTGAPGTGPYLAIVIPDVTPDEGPFIPRHVGHALVRIGGGVTPWPILLQLIELAECRDIVDTDQAHVTADDEILSNNVWLYDGKRFEVNSFHYSDSDSDRAGRQDRPTRAEAGRAAVHDPCRARGVATVALIRSNSAGEAQRYLSHPGQRFRSAGSSCRLRGHRRIR